MSPVAEAIPIRPAYPPTGSMGAHGQSCAILTLEELVTIADSAYTDTTIQFPADAIAIAASVRVIAGIPVATAFDVGVSGATTRYGTGISDAVGTTNPGTDDALRWYQNATAVRITPNALPDAATGRVRVTIHYIKVSPPTS